MSDVTSLADQIKGRKRKYGAEAEPLPPQGVDAAVGRSVVSRPKLQTRGHTGYLTFARRSVHDEVEDANGDDSQDNGMLQQDGACSNGLFEPVTEEVDVRDNPAVAEALSTTPCLQNSRGGVQGVFVPAADTTLSDGLLGRDI